MQELVHYGLLATFQKQEILSELDQALPDPPPWWLPVDIEDTDHGKRPASEGDEEFHGHLEVLLENTAWYATGTLFTVALIRYPAFRRWFARGLWLLGVLLHRLLIEGEGWQPVVTGLAFADAPTTDAAGDFYFSDMRPPAAGVYKVALDGTRTRLSEEAVSGLKFGPDGRMYACQGAKKRLIAIHPATAVVESASFGGTQQAPYGMPYALGAVMAQHVTFSTMDNVSPRVPPPAP